MEETMLPKFGYYLDESDPDIVILRRSDGSFVAAFSARGATKEAIVQAAEQDYGELIRAQEVATFDRLRQASASVEKQVATNREVRGTSRRSSSQNTPSTHSSGE